MTRRPLTRDQLVMLLRKLQDHLTPTSPLPSRDQLAFKLHIAHGLVASALSQESDGGEP